jgi:hypothetical protein
MQFSLAPPSDEPQPPGQSNDDDFDLLAFTQSVTGLGQAEVPAMDISMPPANMGDPPKLPEKTPDQLMDDIFNLEGTSMDMDLNNTADMGDSAMNFDSMFSQAGETDIDFDETYFKL